MNEEPISDTTNPDETLLEVGMVLGQNYAFGLVAGRCSAAQAEALRRLRDERLYKRCSETWLDFCPKYLKMSKTEADRTIKLLEEFGPAYFELSQLTRVSPETFRMIAPNIEEGVLRHNGEAIELNPENSRKVAAAVAELRAAIPKKSPEMQRLTQELNDLCHESNMQERIHKLAQLCFSIAKEFEKISCDERLGSTRWYFTRALTNVRDEMARVAAENGVAEAGGDS